MDEELSGIPPGGSDFVNDELGVDYEPIGSLGGIMRLAQPDVDFAASDAPLPPDELAKRDLAQFPVVIGGLAAVVNLDGVQSGQLKLTGDVLAQIYLGKIAKVERPALLAALNPGISLPDLPIAVVPPQRRLGLHPDLDALSFRGQP